MREPAALKTGGDGVVSVTLFLFCSSPDAEDPARDCRVDVPGDNEVERRDEAIVDEVVDEVVAIERELLTALFEFEFEFSRSRSTLGVLGGDMGVGEEQAEEEEEESLISSTFSFSFSSSSIRCPMALASDPNAAIRACCRRRFSARV